MDTRLLKILEHEVAKEKVKKKKKSIFKLKKEKSIMYYSGWRKDDKPVNKEEKYRNIKKSANDKGYAYLYITKEKENLTYIEKAIKLFEGENSFFLFDEKEDNWQKFVNRVGNILKEK